MKDIPIFTTEYGIASLTLSQIPYRKTAYIQVQTVLDDRLTDLIAECVGFCRAVGADCIYWTAQDQMDEPHSSILELCGLAKPDDEKVASLFPVTAQTVAQWRQLHNDRMKAVDHARFLTGADEASLVATPAYFIHRGETLLGIGWIKDSTILAIASVHPGAGEQVLHTMMSLAPEAMLRLEVASTNEKAIALYQRNGFVPVKTLKKWFTVQ